MASFNKPSSKNVPVTSAAEVRQLAGPLSDHAIAQVLGVGASFEELDMAARYMRGEGDLVDRAGHPLSGRVARLYEILSAEEADDEERVAPR